MVWQRPVAVSSAGESAAATRRSLLDAAGSLLAEGGAEAVTLRAVGSQAGVTRGAPYGHFDDKQHLLAVLAAESWNRLTERLSALRNTAELSADQRVRSAVLDIVDVGTRQPHLYGLMFVLPVSHPEVVLQVASRTQDVFLELVAAVVGPEEARATGALLMAGAHGIAGMESSGHLGNDKWQVTAEQLVVTLVDKVTGPR